MADRDVVDAATRMALEETVRAIAAAGIGGAECWVNAVHADVAVRLPDGTVLHADAFADVPDRWGVLEGCRESLERLRDDINRVLEEDNA